MGFLDMAAGAAGGLGGAVEKVGLSQVQAEIQRERDARLREWRNTDTVAAEGRAEARQIAAEGRAPGNAAAVAEATIPAQLRLAEGQSGVRINEHTRIAAIDMQREIDTFKQLAPLKRQEIIDTEVARVKALASPEVLKATRAIAMASHIVDPSYTLIPNADGTVTTFDTKSGKSGGTLKDADGNAIVRKDPEEMKAAVSVINLANTNLKIAESAYKVDSTSLEPGAKEKAEIAWKEAQRQARELTAPAYAVLYGKAKIPGVSDKPVEDKPGAPPAGTIRNGYEFKGGDPNDKNNWVKASAKSASSEPTTKLPPGAPDPNDRLAAERAAARRAEAEAADAAARSRREQAREADKSLIAGFNAAMR